MDSEDRRGLGTRLRLKCSRCPYVSEMHNLYEEVQTNSRGRKPATVNYGLQVGLSQTPIGSSSLRKIFMATNTPPPAESSLQKTSNTVMQKVVTLNKCDMKERCKKLVNINKLRGAPNPNNIGIQCDGMYNNPLYSGVGETPFQPATQTVFSLAEDVTSSHEIISLVTKNKICPEGQHLKNNPSHVCTEQTCGANIPMTQNIGDEFTWAKEGIQDLLKNDLNVKDITSDPDSTIFKAAESLYAEGKLSDEPRHFVDTRHLAENVRKAIKKDESLQKIMPKSTKAERTKLLHNFAIDFTDRCTGEINQAQIKCTGHASKIKKQLSYVSDAIICCYMGEHALCKKHSLVCKGGKRNWLTKSAYLDGNFKIPYSRANARILQTCVNRRLAPSVLDKSILNTNTQKVESFNRRLRRSLPKNVTFARNFHGRAHSAAHSTNNGPGESIKVLCAGVGAPIPEGGGLVNL
ncbi:uncharacterized protein LOC134282986 [Saccostrea cucullata]|uniref:uncharacterized protein LOC134282986 n=1 Tax=Saccostrea cuccullata TaxID=36930 RepID=UPI002ED361B7